MHRPTLLLLSCAIATLTTWSSTGAESQHTPMTKEFRLSAEEIEPLATGRGGAIASDRITVDGMQVGYMYRLEPLNDLDSGWCFLAGDESEDYMNNPDNHAIFDVNTIANYDREIIRLLGAPVGSAFIRTSSGLVPDPQGAPDS